MSGEKSQNPTSQPPPLGGEGGQEEDKNLTPQPPSLGGKGENEEDRALTPPPLVGKGVGGLGSSAWPAVRARLIAFALIALVGVGVWYFAIRTGEARDDAGRFQGEWQLAVPATARDGSPAARPKPVVVRVKGDRWVFFVGEAEQKRYTVVLRPTAGPKEIDLTLIGPDDKPKMVVRDGKPAPVVMRGVYAIESNRAKVVFAPDPEPRPATLDTDGDAHGSAWLLERLK